MTFLIVILAPVNLYTDTKSAGHTHLFLFYLIIKKTCRGFIMKIEIAIN